MPRTKQKFILNKETGETELKWVQVSSKTGRKIPSQNKLKGKTAWGYYHEDFKEWGQQGGRPKKWNSEAERKKAFRLRKKLAGNQKTKETEINFPSQSSSAYSHSNSRPGAWTYHPNRPATINERVRKHRGKLIQ